MAILLRHRQLTIPSPDPAAATTTSTGGNPLAASDGAGANRMADGGEDFGLLLNYSIWLMTGVSLAVLVLRVYCKVSRKRTLWWDDWVLKLSWVCMCVVRLVSWPRAPISFLFVILLFCYFSPLNYPSRHVLIKEIPQLTQRK